MKRPKVLKQASFRAMFAASLAMLVSGQALAQVDAEAVAGSPFGVGRVSMRLGDDAARGLSGVDAFHLIEKNDRDFYPV
ncbi:MAG: hypothetical protein WD176_05660, partial [Pirellulales bacterium]